MRMQRLILNCTIALTVVGFAANSLAQTTAPETTKFITIGDILQVDPKSKSITINDAISYNYEQLDKESQNAPDGSGGARSGGRRGGGGGRGSGGGGRGGGGGGGRGGGGGGGGGSTSSGGRVGAAAIPKEYKVSVSPKTVFKEGDNDIKFDDLKKGDHIQVFSAKGGSKLEATQIVRIPKD
jgi:hypothetical protein